MPATVMAARMEDVTGERDPWQDSPDPWAGLLNHYNLEDSQHSSIDSIGLTSANANLTHMCPQTHRAFLKIRPNIVPAICCARNRVSNLGTISLFLFPFSRAKHLGASDLSLCSPKNPHHPEYKCVRCFWF